VKRRHRALRDREIHTVRAIGRRSALLALGVVLGPVPEALAQVIDRDPSDPAGRGRGCTGSSDSDTGASHDPAGCGRRHRTGIDDRDPHDPTGSGRGRGSCSDADPSDPAGYGRRC
jgi:hypothetical protein